MLLLIFVFLLLGGLFAFASAKAHTDGVVFISVVLSIFCIVCFAFVFCVVLENEDTMRTNAIERKAAYYDSKTGEFKWVEAEK